MNYDLNKIVQLVSDGQTYTIEKIAIALELKIDSATAKIQFLQSRGLLPSPRTECDNMCNVCNGKCFKYLQHNNRK